MSGVACTRLTGRLEAYINGDLDPAAHAEARGHLASCAACREALRQAEPLMMFSDLAAAPRPAAAWDGFWEGIQAALPARQEPGREPDRASAAGAVPGAARVVPLRRAVGRRAAAWLAAAAAIVLLVAAYMFSARFEGPTREGAPAPLVASGRTPSAQAPLPAGTPLPQTVEQVNTPGARPVQVFSMAYRPEAGAEAGVTGSPEQVTELVLIVDAGLEL